MSGVDLVSNPANDGPVAVNVQTCRRLAAILTAHSIPQDHEDSSLAGFTPFEIGNFYFLLVAISHQTSPRGREPLEGTTDGRHLRGWDYLSAKLEEAVSVNPSILSPLFWDSITAEDVRGLFHDQFFGDRLSDTEGRAQLIRDLGLQMRRYSWNSVEEIYRVSGGFIDGCDVSLLSLLARFRAYDDPVHKKSFFFLALMRNAGLWRYKDPDNLALPSIITRSGDT